MVYVYKGAFVIVSFKLKMLIILLTVLTLQSNHLFKGLQH
jgi:hypothetical protein